MGQTRVATEVIGGTLHRTPLGLRESPLARGDRYFETGSQSATLTLWSSPFEAATLDRIRRCLSDRVATATRRVKRE